MEEVNEPILEYGISSKIGASAGNVAKLTLGSANSHSVPCSLLPSIITSYSNRPIEQSISGIGNLDWRGHKPSADAYLFMHFDSEVLRAKSIASQFMADNWDNPSLISEIAHRLFTACRNSKVTLKAIASFISSISESVQDAGQHQHAIHALVFLGRLAYELGLLQKENLHAIEIVSGSKTSGGVMGGLMGGG